MSFTARVAAMSMFLVPVLGGTALGATEPVDLSLLGRTVAPGAANKAEIAAFDPGTNRVFATNGADNQLDVYDFTNPAAPVTGTPIELEPFGGSDAEDFGPSSVDVKDGVVAVALQGRTPQQIGTVQFFSAAGARLGEVRTGALPDMLTFTANGDYLLVANEGEPSSDGLVDPEGSVTVIDMRGGVDDLVVRQAGFHGVPLRGPVRIFTPNTEAPRDLEPEYIATRGDTAYVSIQEANAIGLLDIPSGRFRVVRSLGFKDWGADAALDTSNGDDGGILLRSWENLYGMYQPDAVAAYALKERRRVRCARRGDRRAGKRCFKTFRDTFVATANEGDARAYDFFDEEAEVQSDITLDPTAFAADAADPDNLGELKVTNTLGDTDGDGDFDRLYAFGGRSLSILDADGKVNFDTGGELEEISRDLDAANFNKSNTGDSVDNRSDDKGPEPEAVTTGTVAGRKYAFVAAERSGGIYAYDLEDVPGEASFAGFLNTRPADRGPEGAKFVPAADSPTGQPMLLLTYEVSSTVAAYGIAAAAP